MHSLIQLGNNAKKNSKFATIWKNILKKEMSSFKTEGEGEGEIIIKKSLAIPKEEFKKMMRTKWSVCNEYSDKYYSIFSDLIKGNIYFLKRYKRVLYKFIDVEKDKYLFELYTEPDS